MNLFDLEVSTGGMEDLIYTFFEGILELNLKNMDFDYLGELLTLVAPIWNPIWAGINDWLGGFIGL